eukprot:scaffold114186_cov27-Tisochrysis_lutea.AAC.1
MYPENSRGQGEGEGSAQSFTTSKVEVSGMRTMVGGGGCGRGCRCLQQFQALCHLPLSHE